MAVVSNSGVTRIGPLGSPVWVRCSLAAADRVLPRQTANVVSQRLFRLPEGPATRLREPAPTGSRPFTLEHNGTELHGWDWGTANRLLYVTHGWAGCIGDMHHVAAAAVEAGWRVVGVDGPSHGNSGPSIRGERYSSFQELAGAIQAVMTAFGPPDAVAAHSMGAINITYAMRQIGVTPGRIAFFAPFVGGEAFPRGLREGIGVGPATMRYLRPLAEAQLGTTPTEVSLFHNPLDVPTFVVHDRGDRAHHWTNAQALSESWPHTSLMLTQGLGHRKILRESETIDPAIRFLNAP